jgi:hypothetical protein
MIKITNKQKQAKQERPFIGTNIATGGGSPGGCLPANWKSDLNIHEDAFMWNAYDMQEYDVKDYISTNNSAAASSTNHSPI